MLRFTKKMIRCVPDTERRVARFELCSTSIIQVYFGRRLFGSMFIVHKIKSCRAFG